MKLNFFFWLGSTFISKMLEYIKCATGPDLWNYVKKCWNILRKKWNKMKWNIFLRLINWSTFIFNYQKCDRSGPGIFWEKNEIRWNETFFWDWSTDQLLFLTIYFWNISNVRQVRTCGIMWKNAGIFWEKNEIRWNETFFWDWSTDQLLFLTIKSATGPDLEYFEKKMK